MTVGWSRWFVTWTAHETLGQGRMLIPYVDQLAVVGFGDLDASTKRFEDSPMRGCFVLMLE